MKTAGTQVRKENSAHESANLGANFLSEREHTAQDPLVLRPGQLYTNLVCSKLRKNITIGALGTNVLIQGDAKVALDLLPKECIQTVITSPPYWSLRDYEVRNQIGCFESLSDYIEDIVAAFRQIRRVLAPDGTVWLNLGDAYTSGNRQYRAPDKKNPARAMATRPPTPEGLKPKDLIGIPWRLAIALQTDGWWVRSEVIWSKPNAHPESVKDRPTKAHETVFLLSKDKEYFYDVCAIKGPNDRRLRTVWQIPTEAQKANDDSVVNHPAVMPTAIAERCIQLTSKSGDYVLDPFAGSGTTLLASEKLGRKWVGIELKPAYIRLIRERLKIAHERIDTSRLNSHREDKADSEPISKANGRDSRSDSENGDDQVAP